MKSGAFAVAAIAMYAISNLLIERKLSRNFPAVNMVFFYTMTLMLSAVWLAAMTLRGDIQVPEISLWKVMAAAGVVLFFAEVFFFAAYYYGASSTMVATIAVLLPVFVSGMKMIIGENPPTVNQIISMVLAAGAVFFAVKT